MGGVHASLGVLEEKKNGVAERHGLQALEAHWQAVLPLGIAERLCKVLVGKAADDKVLSGDEHPRPFDAEFLEVHPDGAVAFLMRILALKVSPVYSSL